MAFDEDLPRVTANGWTFSKLQVVEAPGNKTECVELNYGITVIKGVHAAYTDDKICMHVSRQYYYTQLK